MRHFGSFKRSFENIKDDSLYGPPEKYENINKRLETFNSETHFPVLLGRLETSYIEGKGLRKKYINEEFIHFERPIALVKNYTHTSAGPIFGFPVYRQEPRGSEILGYVLYKNKINEDVILPNLENLQISNFKTTPEEKIFHLLTSNFAFSSSEPKPDNTNANKNGSGKVKFVAEILKSKIDQEEPSQLAIDSTEKITTKINSNLNKSQNLSIEPSVLKPSSEINNITKQNDNFILSLNKVQTNKIEKEKQNLSLPIIIKLENKFEQNTTENLTNQDNITIDKQDNIAINKQDNSVLANKMGVLQQIHLFNNETAAPIQVLVNAEKAFVSSFSAFDIKKNKNLNSSKKIMINQFAGPIVMSDSLQYNSSKIKKRNEEEAQSFNQDVIINKPNFIRKNTNIEGNLKSLGKTIISSSQNARNEDIVSFINQSNPQSNFEIRITSNQDFGLFNQNDSSVNESNFYTEANNSLINVVATRTLSCQNNSDVICKNLLKTNETFQNKETKAYEDNNRLQENSNNKETFHHSTQEIILPNFLTNDFNSSYSPFPKDIFNTHHPDTFMLVAESTMDSSLFTPTISSTSDELETSSLDFITTRSFEEFNSSETKSFLIEPRSSVKSSSIKRNKQKKSKRRPITVSISSNGETKNNNKGTSILIHSGLRGLRSSNFRIGNILSHGVNAISIPFNEATITGDQLGGRSAQLMSIDLRNVGGGRIVFNNGKAVNENVAR